MHPFFFMKNVTGASFSAFLLNNTISWVIIFLKKQDLDIIEAQSFGYLCAPNVCYKSLWFWSYLWLNNRYCKCPHFMLNFWLSARDLSNFSKFWISAWFKATEGMSQTEEKSIFELTCLSLSVTNITKQNAKFIMSSTRFYQLRKAYTPEYWPWQPTGAKDGPCVRY